MHQKRPISMTNTKATTGVVAFLLIALIAGACSASTTTVTQDFSPVVATSTPADADPENPTEQPSDTEATPADGPGEDATVEDTSAAEDTSDEDPTGEQPRETLDAGEASVELLEAGSEPRRELRFNIAGSCGEITELTQTQTLTQVANGLALPSSGPIGTVTEMATSVAANGDNYDVRAEVIAAGSAPGTSPMVAQGLDAQLSSMIGLTTVSTITNRGIQIPGSTRVEGAEALGAIAPLLEGLTQAQNPLPLEAVGVGARWVTRSVIEVQGLLVETVTTFELESIDDTLVTVGVTGTQIVDQGAVMDLQGIEANVTQWDLTSNGTVTMDLATISPISMSTQGVGTQAFRIDDSGVSTELVQEIATEIQTRTEPNTGCIGRTTRP